MEAFCSKRSCIWSSVNMLVSRRWMPGCCDSSRSCSESKTRLRMQQWMMFIDIPWNWHSFFRIATFKLLQLKTTRKLDEWWTSPETCGKRLQTSSATLEWRGQCEWILANAARPSRLRFLSRPFSVVGFSGGFARISILQSIILIYIYIYKYRLNHLCN